MANLNTLDLTSLVIALFVIMGLIVVALLIAQDSIISLQTDVNFLTDELAKNTVMDIRQNESNCLINMQQSRELFDDDIIQWQMENCMLVNQEFYNMTYAPVELP